MKSIIENIADVLEEACLEVTAEFAAQRSVNIILDRLSIKLQLSTEEVIKLIDREELIEKYEKEYIKLSKQYLK